MEYEDLKTQICKMINEIESGDILRFLYLIVNDAYSDAKVAQSYSQPTLVALRQDAYTD